MSWIETNLKDIVDIKTGKKDANEGDQNGLYRFYTCAKDYSFIKDYAFDEESILVSGNGAYVGYVHYYNGKFDAYQRTYILSNFNVDVFFLYHYLGEKLKFQIHREKQDGATPYITKGTLAKFKIQYPENPNEQTAIATLLSKVDEAIEATQNSIKAAEKLKKALMQNLLTGKLKPDGTWRTEDEFYEDEKFGKVPKGWEVKPLKEMAEIQRGKFSHRPRNEARFYNGIHPFVQTSDVVRSVFYLKEHSQTLSDLGVGVSKKFDKGTIIITIAANIGDVALAKYDVYFPDSLIGIKPDNEVIDSEFLLICLMTKQRLLNQVATESAQKNINYGNLRPLPILYPKKTEKQEEIASKIKSCFEAIEAKQTKIQTLQRLKKSLMQNLLTGKVRLPADFIAQFEIAVEETIERQK
jgi:type I restriction enzyme S subunit